MDDHAFDKWLDQFACLPDAHVTDLPEWQHAVAFIHQFASDTASDGAGSLFYNRMENIDHVANAFESLGELEIAAKVRQVWRILEPFFDDSTLDPQPILIEQCVRGAARSAVDELEDLVNQRSVEFYAKLEKRARANGWAP